MAQPLLALAVAAAIGPAGAPSARPAHATPSAQVAAHALNATAEALAARRNPGRGRLGKPIAVRVLDRAALQATLSASAARGERTGADAQVESTLLDRLGLGGGERPLPPPAELAGHYDVPTRSVLVGDWVDLEAARFALARDAAMAVLDRRFNLGRWLVEGQRGRQNSDAALARQALAEGDATTQALEHADRQGVLPAPRALAEITDGLRATLVAESPGAPPLALGRRLFATLDGLGFVASLRARSPWAVVDKVWREPPRSSEQILHPERYHRGDQPDDVGARMPARPRGGWRIVHADTLGELGTRIFLERTVDAYRAERAAAGWGGDRVLWLRPASTQKDGKRDGKRDGKKDGKKDAKKDTKKGEGDDTEGFAAWVTTWDDETDAADFANEAAAALAALARATPADARPVSGKFRVVDGNGRVYALERRQRAVALVFGAPAGADPVLAELTSAAAKGGRRAGRAR